MNKKRGIGFLALSTAMAMSVLAGCNDAGQEQTEVSSAAPKEETITFPIGQQETLKTWIPPYNGLLNKYPDHSNLPIYQELTKRTNIKFQVTTPLAGQTKEQFNLMIASGELPDIIDNKVIDIYYPGGASKAYADGIIISLNDLQEKYAPDLMKLYETYPDIAASMKTDDGLFLAAPRIIGASRTTSGMIIRQDLLDKVGLPVPTTIDEWYTTLTAFKTKLGSTSPLLVRGVDTTAFTATNSFIGAYGISHKYFVEDGVVKYGPADPRYQDYAATMAKWYKEGLIDQEFATMNNKVFDSKAVSDDVGAFYGFAASGIGKYMNLAGPVNPNYKLVATPYPTLQKGGEVRFFHQDKIADSLLYITTKAKNPELAMAFLNYGFTPEGYKLYNFGIEGTSYNWVDGYPKYTDLILKNPDGLSIADSLLMYQRTANNGATVSSPEYLEQMYPLQEQKDALAVWSKFKDKAIGGNDPTLQGKLTAEEASAIGGAQTQIQTYVDEMLTKFIVGQQPVNNETFAAFQKQINSIGLSNVLKTLQAAEDRFKNNNPDFYSQKAVSQPYDMYKDIRK
ncbi:MAG: transporter substrate-binding protein [Paenibacillaceae bacterium]|nr:transporter substrate-binding protein [Paenibacillaceae bacterium]